MIDRMTDTTITESDVLNKMQRRDTLLTVLMWVLYAYLWMPVISLLAWYVGYEFAFEMVEDAGGVENLTDLLKSFGISIAVIACIIISWSMSQYWRLHNKNRRTGSPPPEKGAEQEMWGITEVEFDRIRNGKIISLNIDESLNLTSITPLSIPVSRSKEEPGANKPENQDS
jgi:biofilm PGA synthesis protein PgaD